MDETDEGDAYWPNADKEEEVLQEADDQMPFAGEEDSVE